MNVPPKTTQSDSVAIEPNSTVNETSDKHIPSSYNASAVQKIPVESLTHRAVSNEGIAGRLRMLSETGRDDGSVERVFALPFGKALLAISYSANNEIRQIAVKSNDFMYPGGELLPEWESLLLRKRRSVGQFSQSDEEQDILAAKRIIVQRARERMLYRSVLKTLEDESAEHEAVTAQMHEIEREMTERYGNLFSLHV